MFHITVEIAETVYIGEVHCTLRGEKNWNSQVNLSLKNHKIVLEEFG